jgi:hypothetical protein
MYVDHQGFELGARAYGEIEFTTPAGTASGWVDAEKGILRVFIDPDPDPLDWAVVCGMLDHLGVIDPGEPGYLRGVYTWTIAYRQPVQEPRTGGTGSLVRVA